MEIQDGRLGDHLENLFFAFSPIFSNQKSKMAAMAAILKI